MRSLVGTVTVTSLFSCGPTEGTFASNSAIGGSSGLAAVVGFAAAAAFACTCAYVAVAGLAFLSGTHLPPVTPIMGELAMTVLFYAPSALVVGWLHHKLVGASRGDV